MPVPTKVAFVKFRHRRDAAVALHLTNSILVDKCIQVIPWRQGKTMNLYRIQYIIFILIPYKEF